tara:strand:+ start:16 stop:219 length:204 start_codon:yes stop_codon:yes gene_type:complete
MTSNQFVIALYRQEDPDLPEVLTEMDETPMYFQSRVAAQFFLEKLYHTRDLPVIPFEEDNLILMRVQ